MLPIGSLVAAVLIILIIQWLRRWMHPRCKGVLPPGSMGLPLIGETLQLFIPSSSLDLHPFFKKRILKYGPIFCTSLMGKTVVVSADPKVNHFILSQEGKSVEMWMSSSMAKLLVQDRFPIGTIHKYMRNEALNRFGLAALKENLLSYIEEMARKTLDNWSEQALVELKHAFVNMMFNLSAKVLFSHEPESSRDEVSNGLTKIVQGLMSLPINIPGTAFHECIKGKNLIMDIIKSKLEERLAAAKTKQELDFLDQALHDMANKKFLEPDLITRMIFGLSFANLETNSSMLTLALWKLSQHPSALKELQVEQEAVLRNRKSLNSSFTLDEYKSMTFTHKVMKEILRLANPTPGFFRHALKDFKVNGYTIPAGWLILLASAAQHLNPDIFDEPLEFNPWRWKDLDSNTVNPNFMPFGDGVRECPGANFSKVFISTFLHVLVTGYRWEIVKTGDIRRTPFLKFEDGVYAKFSKKSN